MSITEFNIAFTWVVVLIALYLISKAVCKQPFSLFSLFNIMFFLIYISRFLLNIVEPSQSYFIYKFYPLSISEFIYLKWLGVVFIGLLFTHFGYARASNVHITITSKYIEFLYSDAVQKRLYLFFIFLSPILLITSIQELQENLSSGYLTLFIEGKNDPLHVKITTYFYTATVSIILSCTQITIPRFLKVASIFLIIKALGSFGAARGEFVLPLLAILVIYNIHFGLKINRYFIFLLMLFIVFIAYSSISKSFEYYSNGQVVSLIINEISNTSLIIPYILEFAYLFDNSVAMSIFAPFNLIPFEGQTLELLYKNAGLGHHLTALLSRTAYLNGEGIGSSYIAELLVIHPIALVLGASALGFIISVFESSFKSSNVLRVFSFLMFQHLIYTPRTSYFPPMVTVITFFIAAIIIYLVNVNFNRWTSV